MYVVESPHGRVAAVATGGQARRPDSFVFTYQGDGDLAAISTAEMLSPLEGASFAARVAVNNIKNLKKAKAALKRAFEYQVNGWSFACVEFISSCPTNWKMTAEAANA